ncbi:MAG TPA: hypothetical protein VHL98_22000 [Microvirga sp.]|jgi:hypothetical protein|nr:hypothetical protein [Microvirga sp.]
MPDPVETIIAAYVEAADGDRDEALRRAVSDALADLTEAERRVKRAERMISRGYARGEIRQSGGIASAQSSSWKR